MKFTKNDIEHYRKQYALWTSRGRITPEELHLIGRLRDALDHIEHLQKRVEELEGLLDVVEDKKQTVFEVLKNTITRRDEYIVKLENKISDINLHIAKAEARIQELEDEKQAVWKEWLEETKKKWDEEDKQELKNKCANCGLAISHGIWGDEDNDYDNLPKLPQDEE